MPDKRVPVKDVGRVSIDVNKFGRGMETMLSGMSEVWGSLGINFPAETPSPNILSQKTATPEAPSPEASDTDTPPFDVDPAEGAGGAKTGDAKTGDAEAGPEAPAEPRTAITCDDIIRVIVEKIQKGGCSNEGIRELLLKYSVQKVSDLKEDQFEAFMTDLAGI